MASKHKLKADESELDTIKFLHLILRTIRQKSKLKLTHLQERFKNNILMGMNGKSAYIKAGYKARGAAAEVNASRLLRNAKVATVIEKAQKRAAYNAEITSKRLLKEEACIAFQIVGAIFDKNGALISPDELPEEVQRTIAGLEIIKTEVAGVKTTKYKYKFWDKGRSLERLEKYLGMFEKENKQNQEKIEEIKIQLVSANGDQSLIP